MKNYFPYFVEKCGKMKISEITGTSNIEESIKILKPSKPNADISILKSQYYVSTHDTINPAKRLDKQRKSDTGESIAPEKVNRLAFPIQKRIVDSSVSFAFGTPIKLNCTTKDKKEQQVFDILKKIFYENKIDSFNRKIARDLFRSTEVAEIWFPTQKDANNLEITHQKYGVKSPFELKAIKLSPWNGDLIKPIFDNKENLMAISRYYVTVSTVNVETEHLDCYTDEEFIEYKKEKGGTWEGEPKKNTNGKIPVIYAKQEQAEWEDVQFCIDRLEKLLSNNADSNDYHASPTLFMTGELKSVFSKGEQGKLVVADKGADAKYVSWDKAPESIKLEIDTLFKIIYSLTQTPDISFENVKELSQISGVALEMLFMDAHLKVAQKREILDSYLQRRISVVKSFIALIDASLKDACESVEIRAEIVPYMINDKKAIIDNLFTANAGKAIISQKTSIAQSGLVSDIDAEFSQIQEEEKATLMQDIGNSVA